MTTPPPAKPLVYLAGPYTTPDPVENTHKAIAKAETLMGFTEVTVLVPHLSAFWHFMRPKPYPWWLAYDLEIMRRCDVVFRMEGASHGADAEVAEAERLGIPVVNDISALRRWVEEEWAVSSPASYAAARKRADAGEKLADAVDRMLNGGPAPIGLHAALALYHESCRR